MKLVHVSAVLAVLACAASCAATRPAQAPSASAKSAALLSSLALEDAPEKLPDADRVVVEGIALKLIAEGPAAVKPILDDLKADRGGDRRLALVRILFRIVRRQELGSAERADCEKEVVDAGRKFLQSSQAPDRYTGIVLIALASKSDLVPTAVSMLEDADGANRGFAIGVLSGITGIDMGYRADAETGVRKAAAKRWREWWTKNKDRAFYRMPAANPVQQSLTAHSTVIDRVAGPYGLEVIDASDAPVAGAVVAYTYYFTTPDGRGEKKEFQATTDDNGRMLTSAETASSDMQFIGAEIIVSKAGCKQAAIHITPHVLTPNRFAIQVKLEREAG